MAEKLTGYEVCQEMVEAIQAEIIALKQAQRSRVRGDDLAGRVHFLARSAATLQSEIRKTIAGADDAVGKLPAERRVELIIRLIKELSPEYRAALQQFMSELGVGLQ